MGINLKMKNLLIFLLVPFISLCQLNEDEGKSFIKHTVELHDSYYTLKSQYNVTRRELVFHNPFLKGSIYLHNFHGSEIIIPIKELYNNKSSDVKVALLLPFHTNFLDSLFYEDDNSSINDIHYKQYKSLDFYKGFLFSINEFTEKGNQIDLYVFDTYQNTDSVKIILENLKGMDLVVGPMYQKNFNIVKDFFYDTKTVVVSPYINNINSNIYSDNIFFTECNEIDQLKYISKYIFENYYDHNISIFSKIDTLSLKDDKRRDAVKFNFDSNMRFKNIMTVNPTLDSIHHELDTIDFNNLVLIPETDPVFVIDLISKLHAFKRDSALIVFCLDKINEGSFNQIPTYELNNLNVHFASNKNYSYNYSDFIIDFHKIFSTDPRNKHLIKGYHTGKYFLEYLIYDSRLIDREVNILGFKYKFLLEQNNFYRNNIFDIWYYNNFNIKRVND